MTTCNFAQHFWGKKHAGFNALNRNFKNSNRTSVEFSEFLREICLLDDQNYKTLIKLSKLFNNFNSNSSFKYCWLILKRSIDQLTQVNLNVIHERHNLSKDVQKYSEEQQKLQKSLKDNETSHLELNNALQAASLHLQKAKEIYYSRYYEYKRNESNFSRETDKPESKLKKAQDEYKYSVEKYNNLRNQYVSKMRIACTQFQEIEMAHINQMRDFILRYTTTCGSSQETFINISQQFNDSIFELTTDKLLNMFVSERGTGTIEPADVQFEDVAEGLDFSLKSNDHNNDNSTHFGVKTLGAFFGKEIRASSALATVSSNAKNGDSIGNDLINMSVDPVSLSNIPVNVNQVPNNKNAKRRDTFFRRHQNQNSLPATPIIRQTSDSNALQISKNSLSAFSVVSKSDKSDKGNKLSKESNDFWQKNEVTEILKDEEGFSIRPENPWCEDSAKSEISNDSFSDSDNSTQATFRGIKVNIRPVGDLAPAIIAQQGIKLLPLTLVPNQTLNWQNLKPDANISDPLSGVINHPILHQTLVQDGNDLINENPTPSVLPIDAPILSLPSSSLAAFPVIKEAAYFNTFNFKGKDFLQNTNSNDFSILPRPRGNVLNLFDNKIR